MHKKACKKRAAELHNDALFRPLEPNEDCPICFLPLPHHVTHKMWMSCCGKELCLGCIHAADELDEDGVATCPFCRALSPKDMDEWDALMDRRMQKGDCISFNCMASMYLYGKWDYEIDEQKALKLFLKAGKLGSSEGYCNAANIYSGHQISSIEKDMKKAKNYYELAAIGGNNDARSQLALMEMNFGNTEKAMKHYLIAARAGYTPAMKKLQPQYSNGNITKEEFEQTLREHKDSADSMKSEQRDVAVASNSDAVPDCTVS
ncbi:hypothetical protein ACHAXR_002155 [Thalassiosira sp. AJA248-18]